MSKRLTGLLDTKCSMSPWDWCGQDATCKRDCFKPEPCELPHKLRRLAEYEDLCFDADGNEVISLAHLRELADAEREGRETENKPLTEDQIKQRDGKPIWLKSIRRYGVVGKRGDQYVVGFSYGWEWLKDTIRHGEIYATEPKGEPHV